MFKNYLKKLSIQQTNVTLSFYFFQLFAYFFHIFQINKALQRKQLTSLPKENYTNNY